MTSETLIDVYNIVLDGNLNEYAEHFALLSDSEQRRASKFKFERHRIDWVRSRAALRMVLAQHSQVAPKELQFLIRPDGKPELQEFIKPLPGPHRSPERIDESRFPIHFNLSHSGKRALIAVSQSCEIGCDIEHVKRIRDWPAVTRRFFSPAEQDELALVKTLDKNLAFYMCWTRKEAVIKNTGEGLRADLSSFDVSLTPGKQALVYEDRGADSAALPWHLFHLNPADDYVGAVAVRARSIPALRVHSDWELSSCVQSKTTFDR